MDRKLRKPSIAQTLTKLDEMATDIPKTRAKLRTKYKLEAKNPFKRAQVEKILEDVLTLGVSQFYYNPQECKELCKELAGQIRTKVKALNYDRCKLVCVVEMVQKNLQAVRSVCSFLWDPKNDHYAMFTYNKFDLMATAYVFGVYYD